MKIYIKSATILFAALAFAGCSKVEELNSNPDSALQIESVGGVSQYVLMQAQPASKAVIDGNALPVSEAAQGIGIFVTAQDGSAYDGHDKGYSNVEYTYNGKKWSTATPIYLSGNTGKLYGYFPYNAGATNLKAVPVASSLNGTDYLYAEQNEVSISKKSVSLQMNHALARLHLTLKKGEKYKAEGNISKITLKSTAIDATGTMDITTGEVSATKAKTDKGVVELAASGSLSAGDQTYDILLVPVDASDVAKPFDIIISIDGTTAGVSLSGENGITVQSGKQYDVTLEIQDSGIKVASVGVGLWGEGGSQQVQVGEHTVTVKLSDDAGIVKDVMVTAYNDNENVIVKTYSDSGKPLIIREEDGKLLAPVEEGNKSTFTFSDVTEDITATLAYAKIITVKASFNADLMPNVEGYPNDFAEGEEAFIEGREHNKVTIKVNDVAGYQFDSLVCGKTKVLANSIELKNIVNDTEVKAYYTYTDWLGGVFSVSDSTKVRFSRGNLWCKGKDSDEFPAIESWGFETSQYITQSNRAIDHISHFMWCKSASESVKLSYAEQGTTISDNLFTNASPTEPNVNFAVNGQKGFWRALSGGDNGEWEYLIKRKNGTLCKSGVKVCSSENCLILLPDDWKWGKNGVGDNWQDGGYPETSTKGKVTWKTMEAAGAVCLPAAGYRNSSNGTGVSGVGFGEYWSSTPNPNDYDSACDLYFYNSSSVNPASVNHRYYAYSVRLVTDVK